VTNLPGSRNYDPRRPWWYRFDAINNKIAANFASYVDDIRVNDEGDKECQQTTHCIASKINYLGQQDAPRKRRKVSQEPGAWAGATVCSVPGVGLFASISEEKWEKAQGIIRKWVSRLDEAGDTPLVISHKELEQDTGFLVHLAMTFDNAKPLLKGFDSTLNSWRWDRKEEGWKRSNKEWKHLWSDLENDKTVEEILSEERSLHWKQFRDHLREGHNDDSALAEVLALPRFALDVKSLSKIFW